MTLIFTTASRRKIEKCYNMIYTIRELDTIYSMPTR